MKKKGDDNNADIDDDIVKKNSDARMCAMGSELYVYNLLTVHNTVKRSTLLSWVLYAVRQKIENPRNPV